MIKTVQDLFLKTTTQTVEVKREDLIKLIEEKNVYKAEVVRLKAQIEMLKGRVELSEMFQQKQIDFIKIYA